MKEITEYQQAVAHFKKVDNVLYEVAQKVPPVNLGTKIDPSRYLQELCDTIVSQQLSRAVADTIWTRVLELFPNRLMTEKILLELSDEDLRACGLSSSKVKYLQNIAKAKVDFSRFPNLSDQEIHDQLIQIKGVGPWTVEMFLMFTLGRADVFSYGDLGLKKARQKWSGLQDPEVWSPFRSYASMILWRSLELDSK